MLLGSAVLGAVAAGRYESVLAAMNAMNATGRTITPAGGRLTAFHEAKHQVFQQMHRDFVRARSIMHSLPAERVLI